MGKSEREDKMRGGEGGDFVLKKNTHTRSFRGIGEASIDTRGCLNQREARPELENEER